MPKQSVELPFAPRRWQLPLDEQSSGTGEVHRVLRALPLVTVGAEDLEIRSEVRAPQRDGQDMVDVALFKNRLGTIGAFASLQPHDVSHIGLTEFTHRTFALGAGVGR